MTGVDERASKNISIVDSGCWEWTGCKDQKGYGMLSRGGKTHRAHRWVYEAVVSKIGDGLTIDHLCRNRACVNPDHLEPVAVVENVMRGEGVCVQNSRKTHCKNGHALSVDNLVASSHGKRVCKKCHADAVIRYRSRIWTLERSREV